MSKQEELEAKIREQRTVEANKKGFIGQNGKIGTVLKMMGQPIVSHSEGGAYVDTNYLEESQEESPWPVSTSEFMNSIPVMDLDGNVRPETEEWAQIKNPVSYGVYNVGWHFDGLSRGMHLEIKYDDTEAKLVVLHKGYVVYKEIKGEIVSYVPKDEWEGWIEVLYKKAKEIQRRKKEIEFEDQVKESEKIKASWWAEMKSRWGLE